MRTRLREIDAAYWLECIALEPEPEQARFVTSNMYSLAEAKADSACVPFAVYAGCAMMAFVMYTSDPGGRDAWVLRLMIDRKHQRAGHGRDALRALLRRLRDHEKVRRVLLSLVSENTAARRLYEAAGLEATGEHVHGEDVLCLRIDRSRR